MPSAHTGVLNMVMPKALRDYWAKHGRGTRTKKSGGRRMARKKRKSSSGRRMHLAPVVGAALTGVLIATKGGTYSPINAAMHGRVGDALRYAAANAMKLENWAPAAVGGAAYIAGRVLHISIPLTKKVSLL